MHSAGDISANIRSWLMYLYTIHGQMRLVFLMRDFSITKISDPNRADERKNQHSFELNVWCEILNNLIIGARYLDFKKC